MKEDKTVQIKNLKRIFYKMNRIQIILIALTVAGLFFCSLFFHEVIPAVLGVVIEFSYILYIKNKLSAFIEDQLYKK